MFMGEDRKGKGTKEGKTRRPQQGDCKIVFIPFACLSLAAGVTFHNHPILLPSNFITFYERYEMQEIANKTKQFLNHPVLICGRRRSV